MADSLSDLATRQQIALERIKSAFDRDFRGVAVNLRAKIREVFSKLDVETMGELSLAELNRLLVVLEKAQMKITGAYIADFEKELPAVAEFAAKMEVRQLASLDTGDLPALALAVPKTSELYKAALRSPIQATGDMLKPFIRDWPEMDAQRVNKVVRQGYGQGKTVAQMTRELVGTKKEKFQDGVLAKSTRDVSGVVHTATQHVSSEARFETWQKDKDLGLGYYWLATLDRRTTSQCRGLDTLHGRGSGNPLVYGEGPRPPIHYKCRSTTTPELPKEYEFLLEGGTRPSSGPDPGSVPATETYYSWLKDQPADFQDFAIGPKRGKLFRDGGLSAEKFADLSLKNFQPMTLKEMEAENPEAFTKAKVKP